MRSILIARLRACGATDSLCCTGDSVLIATEALGGPIINAGFGHRRYLSGIAIIPAAAPVPEPATLAVFTTGLLPRA